ncbi:MAG: hypothetical protein GEV13_08865 [Rhodospirillales bacterium]|nr:hypothetical protein [Rhodospirillales bacterium]
MAAPCIAPGRSTTRPTAASCAAPRRSTCRCRLQLRRPNQRRLVKLGIVSDLHCNIDGLDRALETMGPIDALLCLGDSINEYGFSNAVIGRLRELDALTILGNHEEVFLGPAGVRARSRADIDRPLLDWLAEQPHRRELRIGGKRILMVHSTPWEPRGSYVMPTSSELHRFGEADADIVLYGHTHQQVVRRVGRVLASLRSCGASGGWDGRCNLGHPKLLCSVGWLVVNPGSAGDGRDPRNGRQLTCAVLDTVTEEVVVRDFPALRHEG